MQMRVSSRGTVLAICLSSSLVVAKEGSGKFEALTGKVLPGRCDSRSCTWFTIENSELEGIGQHGELFQLKVKWWTSKRSLQNSIPPLTFSGQSQLYVFCSKTNPANITQTPDGKAWKALLLAPEPLLANSSCPSFGPKPGGNSAKHSTPISRTARQS